MNPKYKCIRNNSNNQYYLLQILKILLIFLLILFITYKKYLFIIKYKSKNIQAIKTFKNNNNDN